MSLATAREHITRLAATGAVVTCILTRFENARRTEG